jgi:hypothetical protein
MRLKFAAECTPPVAASARALAAAEVKAKTTDTALY